MKNLIFVPLAKINEEKREVTGQATAQVVDKSGETFHYESSVPYFKSWSDTISKVTKGKSKGNVRSMHQPNAVGKLVDIQFDDANKSISVTAKIVDNAEWEKVQEGVYTGFSIGGKYVKQWEEGEDAEKTQFFTADPIEISIVDNPCVPTAHFTAVKADGIEVQVAFKLYEPTNDQIAAKASELAGDKGTWTDFIELAKDALKAEYGMPAKKEKMEEEAEKVYEEEAEKVEIVIEEEEEEEEEYEDEEEEMEKAESHTPPKSVQAAASRGLKLREEYGRGGTQTGISRARDLSGGKGIPLETIRRMKAFFDRHEKNKNTPPEEGNGKIAWLLWGGDAGRTWAEGIVNAANKEMEKMKEEKDPMMEKEDDEGMEKASPLQLVKQVWVATDGKTFEKKAECVAYQEDLNDPIKVAMAKADAIINQDDEETDDEETDDEVETPVVEELQKIETPVNDELQKAFDVEKVRADKLEKMVGKLQKMIDEAVTGIETLTDELQKIKNTPQPRRHPNGKVVDKTVDRDGVTVNADSEEESLRKLVEGKTPEQVSLMIIKAAQSRPIKMI
jgi:hypothetical protein